MFGRFFKDVFLIKSRGTASFVFRALTPELLSVCFSLCLSFCLSSIFFPFCWLSVYFMLSASNTYPHLSLPLLCLFSLFSTGCCLPDACKPTSYKLSVYLFSVCLLSLLFACLLYVQTQTTLSLLPTDCSLFTLYQLSVY